MFGSEPNVQVRVRTLFRIIPYVLKNLGETVTNFGKHTNYLTTRGYRLSGTHWRALCTADFIFVYVNKNNDSIPHLTLASAATHKNTIFEC